MFKLKFRDPKMSDAMNPEVKQIFLGRNTVFSILSFIIGGVLVGNTIYQFSNGLLGPLNTLVIGLTMFIFGGVLSRTFKK